MWPSRNRVLELEIRVAELERVRNIFQLEHAERMVDLERMYHRLRMILKRHATTAEDAPESPNGDRDVLAYLTGKRGL